ncbi:MAG: 30S ribosomal protein S9 [Chloroflexi bacterium]|nr:30S ribosomal protein S9 [Chloroflexota bacterium]
MSPAEYFYAVGRRKTSVARVRLTPGEGAFVVNGKPANEYFSREIDLAQASDPLRATENENRFAVSALVVGGGVTGQAQAVRMAIARALVVSDESYRARLRALGYLTRDPRAKERKKPGLKRARKAPQYTKR